MLHLDIPLFDLFVLLQQTGLNITNKGLAAIAVGLAGYGAGVAERGIGAASIGAIAEDRDLFGIGLIMTVLPETIVILTLVTVFVV